MLSLTTPITPHTIPIRRPHVLCTVASFVLVLNCVDYTTYVGVSQAFKNLLEGRLGYSKVAASALRSTWTSFCDIVLLYGAYAGDERWGRYKTIVVFSVWYASCALLSLAAHLYLLEPHVSLANICFLVTLFGGIGLSNRAYDPNPVIFGAY
ncbi:hypothetical protein DYB28_011468 [Aphanomyces astaci]|uniref:Uncharacterized protein n=1 Tax=Aphanomyces astaci TaxID=112090 RepID=A0A9X8DP91_APHAT|nr:hypothetical protein DYB28_011468 [Aphanomyces astaci]